MTLSVLLIDNFDSFSFNLVDELEKRGALVEVWRNDAAAEDALARLGEMPPPRLLVLSPGPGTPAEAGCTVELARRATVPVFGVCLGLQGIVEHFGGELGVLETPMHGKASVVRAAPSALFTDLPERFSAGRYHSLFARPEKLPACLRVTARTEDGVVMAVEHRELPLAAVQFHPESILTIRDDLGLRLLANAVGQLCAGGARGRA